MSTITLPRPGPVFGRYPQRTQPAPALWLRWADAAGDRLFSRPRAAARGERDFADALARELGSTESLDAALAALPALRAALSRHGLQDDLIARAQALVARTIEAQSGVRPYDTQHRAARALLANRFVELDTGEGKTLAILIAAATAALAGVPVHVITANDYLARRDADAAQPVLQRLGLSVNAIDPAMTADERRAVYAGDVVYAAAREIGFDYLRDRLLAAATGHPASVQPVLRGLSLALIDEADSVLIDHARTPLVISMPARAIAGGDLQHAMWRLSGELHQGPDFSLDVAQRRAELSASAIDRLRTSMKEASTTPVDPRVAADILCQALVVRHLLQRDRDYLVQPREQAGTTTVSGNEVMLIDQTTGRTAPGTQWSRSLQQLVSIKEGCTPPQATLPAAQITLQTLFSRYWKLGGVSGTLRDARFELRLFYRLGVLRIEPRVPNLRRDLGLRVFTSRTAQWAALTASVRQHTDAGRPVLIGTASVVDSEALAAHLTAHLAAAGLNVQLLNARHSDDEARRLQAAGEARAITVTTQIAGRGADIPLSPAALAAGGLHVICAALNRSQRLDRQLIGRTGRNGLPGSCETLLSLDAGEFTRAFPAPVLKALAHFKDGALPAALGQGIARAAKAAGSWLDLFGRWQLVEDDRRQQSALAYTKGVV